MTKLSEYGSKNLELVKIAANNSFPENILLRDLSICQAILEGAVLHTPPSELALKYNNLFGIKGLGTGLIINGKFMNTIVLPTHEFYNGEMHEVDQRFAVNQSIEDSFEQHKKLFELSRYKSLWEARDFEELAHAVKDCGYATDPRYPQELIYIYNTYLENQ